MPLMIDQNPMTDNGFHGFGRLLNNGLTEAMPGFVQPGPGAAIIHEALVVLHRHRSLAHKMRMIALIVMSHVRQNELSCFVKSNKKKLRPNGFVKNGLILKMGIASVFLKP